MNIHTDKASENKSQAIANSLSKQQSGGERAFQFKDIRPEGGEQGELQEAANNNPHMRQLRAYQEMANNSPQVKQLRAYQAAADNYRSQAAQRKENLEVESLQGKFEPVQKKENKTGLPDDLKTGIENLSGHSLDDVKVHYNSDKPAQLQAHAYAQGRDIHLASGQEKHLPHEAWHVVQQKQGRVKPTIQLKGKVNINDNEGLEKEADVMGATATKQLHSKPIGQSIAAQSQNDSSIVQRQLKRGELNVVGEDHEESGERRDQEESFCEDQVGGEYWLENTFPAKSDTPDQPADTLFLQAKYLLATVREQNAALVNSWATEDDGDGDLDTTSETDEAITNLQETCEEIKDLVKKEIENGLQEAIDWWAEHGKSIEALDLLYQKANSEENPASAANVLLATLPRSTVKQASFDRGVAMNKAAKGQKNVIGVWKIGDHHVKEIKLMRNIMPNERREKDQWYNLLTMQEFNTEYDAWVPPPPA